MKIQRREFLRRTTALADAAEPAASALAAVGKPAAHPRCEHLPPASFRHGEPVAIELAIEAGYNATQAVRHHAL